MKFKKITTFILTLALVFSSTFVTAGAAYANNGNDKEKGWEHGRGRAVGPVKKNWNYGYGSQNQIRNFNFSDETILALIAQLQAMIKLLQSRLDDSSTTISDVSVTTQSATNVDHDSATLRGKLYLNNADEADVYFEYGKSRTNLNEKISQDTIKDTASSFTFSDNISGLSADTLYYFRAVAEDPDSQKTYGSILSFRTDSNSNVDEPSLSTLGATNIDSNSADLRGEVDMNDFDNGQVFFVYGEKGTAVDNIADEYDTYADIDEDGDNLQKVLVDSDLDTADSYQQAVGGLNDNTLIYNAICVEYENEDNDNVLSCGNTKSFRTTAN